MDQNQLQLAQALKEGSEQSGTWHTLRTSLRDAILSWKGPTVQSFKTNISKRFQKSQVAERNTSNSRCTHARSCCKIELIFANVSNVFFCSQPKRVGLLAMTKKAWQACLCRKQQLWPWYLKAIEQKWICRRRTDYLPFCLQVHVSALFWSVISQSFTCLCLVHIKLDCFQM